MGELVISRDQKDMRAWSRCIQGRDHPLCRTGLRAWPWNQT